MGKYRILIVDDDEDARRILSMALRPKYETVEARDGLDALARLGACQPDLAIIDVMMPVMDGYQLCESIRRHPDFNKMPVMFLSAYGSKENARKSYESGGDLFMVKPIAPDRVLKNVDLTVEHSRPPVRVKRHPVEWIEQASAEELTKAGEAWGDAPGDGRVSPGAAVTHGAPAQPAAQPVPRGVDPAATVVPARPAAGGDARARVLVVDDDPETRLMIDLSLRDQYEVVKASNGMEAIERLIDCEPDLMLVDIMMPKMNGYQLLQSVRRNPVLRDLPVVILSAKSSLRDRDYATKLGATVYLAKPYQVEELLQALRAIASRAGFSPRPKTRSIERIRQERIMDEKAETNDLLKLGKDLRAPETTAREPIRNETGVDPFDRRS